jgi:ParB/RepB/Spo0J family partition protein
VRRLPIDWIDTGRRAWSIREWVDEAEIEALAGSIRESGKIDMPITVRPAGERTFELVAGLRRVLAAQRAGLREIDAMVRQLSDSDAFLAALREEACRKALTTLELGWALLRLRAEWSEERDGPYRQKRLAELVGVAESSVSEPMRIAEVLPRDDLAAAGEEYGIPIARLAGLGRKALRPLRAAAPNERGSVVRAVARAIAEAERDREHSLDAKGLTDVALSAMRPVKRGRPTEPCTLTVCADGRLSLTVRRPVGEWSAEQRTRFVKAVGPLLDEARALDCEPPSSTHRIRMLTRLASIFARWSIIFAWRTSGLT